MLTSTQLTQEQILFIQDKSPRKALLAVAGAGKTTTIKALLTQKKDVNKLLIVYNVNLREQLKNKLKDYPNIKVTNIHSLLYNWFKQLFQLKHADVVEQEILNRIIPADLSSMDKLQFLDFIDQLLKYEPPIISYTVLEYSLLHRIIPQDFARGYDIIIIDEVQDLPPKLLVSLLDLFYEKQIILAGDINQTIYSFKGVTAEALLNILHTKRFRVFKLSTSFRTPKQAAHIINKIINEPFQVPQNTKRKGVVKRFIYKDIKQFFRNFFYRLRPLVQPELHVSPNDWATPLLEALMNNQTLAILTRLNNVAEIACKIAGQYNIPLLCIPTLNKKISILTSMIQLAHLELKYGLKGTNKSVLSKLQEKLSDDEFMALLQELLKKSDVNITHPKELIYILRHYPMHALTEHARKLVYTLTMRNQQNIVISTIHAAKGLEFDNILLPDLNKPIFPLKDALLEEEKRLLYVGITRAKQNIFIAHTQNSPSVFTEYFKDIPPIYTWDETPIQRTLLM